MIDKPLFIFEMANNHMGDFGHGKKIVAEIKKITDFFKNFKFAIKLQYRDISFFHPDHLHRKDHKLIKRFTETILGKNFPKLVNEIKKNGFITICTPWDKIGTDYLSKLNIDIFKVASCSFNDWDLLESISKYNRPIIASTAGATKLEIDKVHSFFKNKKKNFSFMHCVGEYPTIDKNLELNQIEYLINRYPGIKIGYSTHEKPSNYEAIIIAISKGACLFEKHVGVETSKYKLNEYSATPQQCKEWLEAATRAFNMCGSSKNIRKTFSEKEKEDLNILYRGAYAKKNIRKGDFLDKKNIFLAMPNQKDQLVAKDIGMFVKYESQKEFKKNEPLFKSNFKIDDNFAKQMDKRFYIKEKILEKLNNTNIIIPKNCKTELSHHFGLKNFFKTGAVLFHIVNKNQYSKIIIMMFAGQSYPSHYHVKKNETYFVLSGDLNIKIKSKRIRLKTGDTYTISNQEVHSFTTKNGVIFEEIATSYIKGDSKYIEKSEMQIRRKTMITLS